MKYKNKKWLYEMYINKKYKCQEIADLCNVSKTTILMWLYKFNIRHPRKRKENIDNRYKDKVFLYQKHIIEQMPMQDIANLCNVSLDAIRYNLRKNGIPIWRSYPPKDLSKYASEIIYKYVNERKSALQLAKEYDCCTTAIKIVLRKITFQFGIIVMPNLLDMVMLMPDFMMKNGLELLIGQLD